MDDPTSLLFGLGSFAVVDVSRVADGAVQVVIETRETRAACPDCGVLTSRVQGRPLVRIKDLPASGQPGGAVVAQAPTTLHRGAVPAALVHPDHTRDPATVAADDAAAGQARPRHRRLQPRGGRGRRRVRRGLTHRAGRGGGAVAAGAVSDPGAGHRRDPGPIGAVAARAGRVAPLGPVADVVRGRRHRRAGGAARAGPGPLRSLCEVLARRADCGVPGRGRDRGDRPVRAVRLRRAGRAPAHPDRGGQVAPGPTRQRGRYRGPPTPRPAAARPPRPGR